MAAKKGILVVNAAGNEGDAHWTIIGAPADADSVLAVGGINPWTGMHTKFSSYGPTADGRLKPNVSALAWVIAANKKNTLKEVQGTSFASPLTAGFAACVLQEFPRIKVMDLFKKIEQSGHLYPYYDYAHGYGIPQASKAVIEQNTIPATFITEVDNGKQKIKILPEFFTEQNFIYSVNFSNNWDDDHVKDENYSSAVSTMVLKKIPNYFYWHVSSPDGKIDTYEVLMVENPDILQIPLQNYIGKTLRFHYKGYTLIQKID
jgi:subtilisin family serine protease